MKKNKSSSIIKGVLFCVLFIYALSIIALLIWALNTSLKTNVDFLIKQNFFGLPEELAFENYAAVFKHFYVRVNRNGVFMRIGFGKQALYTLVYAVGGSLMTALCPFLVAYACSRFNYKFNTVLITIVMLTMVIPIVGSQTSYVAVLHGLGLYDKLMMIFWSKFHFTNLYTLIYIGVLGGVSKSFSEAAAIDGANEFQIMARIVFPLVRNVFFTVMLIFFIEYWNDYQLPLLYMPSHPTLAYGVYFLTNNTTGELNITPRKMSGCMLLVLPITILFIIFKEKLMTNLSMGGVKE